MKLSLFLLLVALIATTLVAATLDIESELANMDLENQLAQWIKEDENIHQDELFSSEEYQKFLQSMGYDHSKYFESDGKTLSAPTLAQMKLQAQLAGASYCVGFNAQALADWKCKACPQSITMQSTTAWKFDGYELGVFAGYDATNKVIRVAYRGSSNFNNWMANLAFAKVALGGGKGEVHSGFRTAYLQTRSEVAKKITSLRSTYGNPSIQVTGHSLGGAVALLATLDWKTGLAVTTFENGLVHVSSELFPEPLPFSSSELLQLGAKTQLATFPITGPFITFGQPRVGNQAFATWATQQLSGNGYFRATHRYDPVPRIPTQSMGFAHANPYEIYFTDKDGGASYKTCAGGSAEDKTCIIGPILNLSISDHLWYATVYVHNDVNSCARL